MIIKTLVKKITVEMMIKKTLVQIIKKTLVKMRKAGVMMKKALIAMMWSKGWRMIGMDGTTKDSWG